MPPSEQPVSGTPACHRQSLFCNVQIWSLLAPRSAESAIGDFHGLYWLHYSGIWHRSVWHMSSNVADELVASVFWGRKAVTVARSSGIWRCTVWQMDVSSDGDFYIQFAVFLATVTHTSRCSLSFIGPLPCAVSHTLRLLVPFQLFTTLLNRFTVCCRPQCPCRAELTNLWDACPKWRAERFPLHAAFTAVPIFLLPNKRLYIKKTMSIYTHIRLRRDCVWNTVATK